MRLGVSGKILLAYAVLLLAFAGQATFTVLTLHQARQGVAANRAYLDLQGAVDSAWKSLNDFVGTLGRAQRPDPNLALALRVARKHMDDALEVIGRYLDREPRSGRRGEFEARRGELRAMQADAERLQARLGAAELATDAAARADFESRLAALAHQINRMRRPLRGQSGQIAQRLTDDEQTALDVATILGLVGLVVAVAAALVIMRTLRPLQVLRARTRALAASGDWQQRTDVHSRDEIGDLAREFDAMVAALGEREQRLLRSERLATVGRMAAQITHEVRNPLASVGLYVELLGDEVGPDNAEAKRLVASITSELDRLTDITETYLRFARLPRPKLQREDLSAIVSDALEFSRAELARAGVALEVSAPPGLPEVAADENQLRQALLNLVRNAREAMAGGGALRVAVESLPPSDGSGGALQVRVSDSGPGIAPEHAARIFEPFFSTKNKGTGLGLAMVQQIVVEHGGRIEVDSRPGQGTTFAITLPVAAETTPVAVQA